MGLRWREPWNIEQRGVWLTEGWKRQDGIPIIACKIAIETERGESPGGGENLM